MDDLIAAAKEAAWVVLGAVVVVLALLCYLWIGGPLPGMHR